MAEVYVPHDVLLNHILPRVPPRSIGRFRCVSKEWHSLLTSDMFQYKHIDHHQDNIKVMLFSQTETSSFEFTTIDCEAPPTGDEGLALTRRPLPQFGDTTPHDICALTSFHGLVCLGIITEPYNGFDILFGRVDFKYSDLILWNPVTNVYKRLSKSDFDMPYNTTTKFGLYYSSFEDDYKLLSVQKSHQYVYIYSLKSDSWRRVDAFQSTHILNHHSVFSRPTYLNENIYFLQYHKADDRQLPSIIKFDTKTERLSKIETPNVDEAYYNLSTIMVKSDCIHLCVMKYYVHNGFRITTNIDLWKLDEYDTKTKWLSKIETLQIRPLEPPNDSVIRFISTLCPFYLMKNGKWLMKKWGSNYKHKIYQVDLNDNDSEYDVIKVKLDVKYSLVLEEGRYIETLVSPNRYTK